MRRTPRQPAGSSEPADPAPWKKPRRWRRRAGTALLVVLGLVLAGGAINAVLEDQERQSIEPYGERVAVGSGWLNVVRNGNQGQPIVLLTGLATAAPGLDFAPLVRELGGFEVIVVEGFGYGYSDMEAPPRTNENISKELHEVLAKLQVKQPYVLAGHSIAGFYMLDYANRYRSEVSAVVGLDATIPKPRDKPVEEPEPGINWLKGLSAIGLVRAMVAVAPDLVDPDSDAYTQDELQRIRTMTIWNFGNKVVDDETARIASNSAKLRGVTYPDDLPVLAFVADDRSTRVPEKTSATQNLLQNVTRHRIITLEGHHYLYWTQAKRMAEEIRLFVNPAPER